MTTRNPYPTLAKLVRILATDNYGPMADSFLKPKSEYVWPKNASELEGIAVKMTAVELETLAAGEHSEQRALVKKHAAHKLNHWLEQVFDGYAHKNFFVD